jgi:hypothetical protein
MVEGEAIKELVDAVDEVCLELEARPADAVVEVLRLK